MSGKIYTTTMGYVGQPPTFPRGDVPCQEWSVDQICYMEDDEGLPMVLYLWAREFIPYLIESSGLREAQTHLAYNNPLFRLPVLPEDTWCTSRMSYKRKRSSVVMLGLGLPNKRILRLMCDMTDKTFDCHTVRMTSDHKKHERRGPPTMKNFFTLEEMLHEAQDLLDVIPIPEGSFLV